MLALGKITRGLKVVFGCMADSGRAQLLQLLVRRFRKSRTPGASEVWTDM